MGGDLDIQLCIAGQKKFPVDFFDVFFKGWKVFSLKGGNAHENFTGTSQAEIGKATHGQFGLKPHPAGQRRYLLDFGIKR